MDQAVHSFVAYVSSQPQYAYAQLFLAALLEAVPVVGSLVPGSTVILSLSALIATGELGFVAVMSAAIAGAALVTSLRSGSAGTIPVVSGGSGR